MRIQIERPGNVDREAEVGIVIDVFRATSTATALMARGIEPLGVVETPDGLRGFRQHPQLAVFSELEELGGDYEHLDNSPSQAERTPLERFAQKTPVLVTTNGTRAIGVVAPFVKELLLGSFMSLSAIVQYARRADSVLIVPAGKFKTNEGHTEDDLCAEAIEAGLRGLPYDHARTIEACHKDPRYARRCARNPNFAEDAEIALTLDRTQAIAKAQKEEAVFWVSRVT